MAIVKGDRIGQSQCLNRVSIEAQDFSVSFFERIPDRRGRFLYDSRVISRTLYGSTRGSRRVRRLMEELREVGIFNGVVGEIAIVHDYRWWVHLERRAIRAEVKAAVIVRDGGRCRRCPSTERIEFDHVIPFCDGGPDTVENLQLLCRICNAKKGRGR